MGDMNIDGTRSLALGTIGVANLGGYGHDTGIYLLLHRSGLFFWVKRFVERIPTELSQKGQLIFSFRSLYEIRVKYNIPGAVIHKVEGGFAFFGKFNLRRFLPPRGLCAR